MRRAASDWLGRQSNLALASSRLTDEPPKSETEIHVLLLSHVNRVQK